MNRKIEINDLSEPRNLDADERKSIQGGGLLSSPLGEKYLPEPNSVWVREIVEDVEAY